MKEMHDENVMFLLCFRVFLFLRISELPEPSLSWNKFKMLAFLHKECRFSETVLTAMLRIQNKFRKKQKQNVSFQIYRYTCVSHNLIINFCPSSRTLFFNFIT